MESVRAVEVVDQTLDEGVGRKSGYPFLVFDEVAAKVAAHELARRAFKHQADRGSVVDSVPLDVGRIGPRHGYYRGIGGADERHGAQGHYLRTAEAPHPVGRWLP